MTAQALFPLNVWQSGTLQNAIPANDNAIRVEVLAGNAIGIVSAQPDDPEENDQYVLGDDPSGDQWGSMTAGNVVIYKSGTWLEFAAYVGWPKPIAGELYVYGADSSGGWTAVGSDDGGMTNPMTTAGDLVVGGDDGEPGRLGVGSDGQVLTVADGSPAWADPSDAASGAVAIPVACSDETTALTAGTAKVTFRMPYAMTLTAVRASLTTAQASGNILTVDINLGGTSILSTKLTIDNTEKTSTTASAAAVISTSALADDAEITIDIDQIGDGTATGLKIYLIGALA